jgi:hypothetical protein
MLSKSCLALPTQQRDPQKRFAWSLPVADCGGCHFSRQQN